MAETFEDIEREMAELEAQIDAEDDDCKFTNDGFDREFYGDSTELKESDPKFEALSQSMFDRLFV